MSLAIRGARLSQAWPPEALTMWVEMTRLREAGTKRSKEDFRDARTEKGRLTLEKARAVEETYLPSEIETVAFFVAKAWDAPYDVQHRLNEARVTRIGEDSFVVVGVETLHLAAGRKQAASVVCRIAPEPAAAEINVRDEADGDGARKRVDETVEVRT